MKMTIYKKFLAIFFLLATFILVSIATINYYVDPGNQFSRSNAFISKAVTLLINQKQAMVGENYNERLLHKMMLEKMQTSPDVLILGSSHSLPITHDLFNNTTFYNASVSAAKLEDDIAFYYLYQKRGWQPKILIICLDPWVLDNDFALLFLRKEMTALWKTTLASDYYNGKKLLFGNSNTSDYNTKRNDLAEKYSQLLSVDYLKYSMNRMLVDYATISIKKMGLLTKPQPTTSLVQLISPPDSNACPSCYTLLPDGARIPTKIQESTTAHQADLSALTLLQEVQQSSLRYQKSSPLDTQYTSLFEQFIHYLKDQNINVVFYLPPLEPTTYTEFVEKNPNYMAVKDVEKYFISVARDYHIKMIGSYDPVKLGLDANDFYDSSHLKTEGIHKLFTATRRLAKS